MLFIVFPHFQIIVHISSLSSDKVNKTHSSSSFLSTFTASLFETIDLTTYSRNSTSFI